MGTFALQIRAWVDKTKGDLDTAVRYCAMAVDGKLMYRSPVGDPTKWKVNPNKPKVFGKFSAVGPKANWQMGFMSGGASTYRTSGAGYVGGRFRGAWMVSIGTPDNSVGTALDTEGRATLEAHKVIIAAAKAGDVIHFRNNMPYADRLEKGWSQQAPLGMVALTVVEWQTIVDNVVNGIRAGTSAAEFAQGFETYSL
ncbi:hypothetical protein [Duganella violaceipulchra]|uniref:Uncharacterized protein n=1 Tax=Duganella violaceipulchra TaxID=2849652 RepID=A0AA41H8P8_9BURK|nr:hypothetical protein [Duganella violaceicalia]MBV6321901.1 hypothetical protein [Duganella violaceicalia]MCP2007105.1 hypothetical protein [Duganella violaceicalia]